MHPDDEKMPEQEVTEDLLALIAFFVGRLYGPRVAQRDYSKQARMQERGVLETDRDS